MDDGPLVVWLVSGYDLTEHAFNDTAEGDQFLQALCEHSVPPDKIVDQSGSALSMKRCVTCMLVFGDLLADYLDSQGPR